MVGGNQAASGGILLTEKAHPEISVSDLRDLTKRVCFLEKWSIYKKEMENAQVGVGQACTPTALKRCIPKAALEGAIIAGIFRRSGDGADEVSYGNLTETEISNWLVPQDTGSDLVSKNCIKQATKDVSWVWDEKFTKATELLASEFATKLCDMGLMGLFGKDKKDMHMCLIEIIVHKIDYLPLKTTMLEQMEISEKVRKTWAGFLSSLYGKALGLDVGGTRNEKTTNQKPNASESESSSEDDDDEVDSEDEIDVTSEQDIDRQVADKRRIPFVPNRFTASNQDDMYRKAIAHSKMKSSIFTPKCPIHPCKKKGARHWLRDCPMNPSEEEQIALLNKVDMIRHERRELKREMKRLKLLANPSSGVNLQTIAEQ